MTSSRPVGDSLRDYGRALAGGLLFSVPLLYTAEIWHQGFLTTPLQQLGLMGATFGLLLAYNRYSGFRRDFDWGEVLVDCVDVLGFSLVASGVLLALLGRITASMSLGEIVGKVVLEAGMVSLGMSIGTSQLGSPDARDQDQNGLDGRERARSSTWSEIAIGFCAAVVVISNVAPTQEILVIAAEAPPWKILGLALASMVLAAVVLHYSDFRGATRHAREESGLEIFGGVLVTYCVGLVASCIILWYFGRFTGCGTELIVSQTVVLAFPATLGSSAGRLLLQPS